MPRIVSISENSWVSVERSVRSTHLRQTHPNLMGMKQVHQKVLLIYGQVGDPRQRSMDGTLTVHHHQDSFPSTSWPVTGSHFKALVHLVPGSNRLRFDYAPPKRSSIVGSPVNFSTWFNINYLPLSNAPPLDLVILLGKDSEGTYDAVPERKQREGNDLTMAVRKYRMAAYLWQAFTGEQMFRNSFGRRCFRFEEEWQVGTLSCRDTRAGRMRNEAKVHIVRTEKTVAELRDLNLAQQYGPATNKDGLFRIAKDAVRAHFGLQPGQERYVAVLLLDSHWDTEAQTITGHAAAGSGGDDIKLAIFGSHCLQSYPCCIEEVVPAFSDCTRTDTRFVANDCGEAGSNWEAANIGIGAHLHEVGHLFGCPHQESGIMLRDYVRFNRTFTTREPYSTRTKSQGMRLCLPTDECQWHRLDVLRFRFHPCFRLPSDPPVHSESSIQIWPVENGKILITAVSGVAFIEVYGQGDDICKHFIDFANADSSNNGVPRQVTVTEAELRQLLPVHQQRKKIRLEIYSGGRGRQTIHDLGNLTSKESAVKLAKGQVGYRCNALGCSKLEGSQPVQVILSSVYEPSKLLTSIKVYHGAALYGIEFFYDDATSQLFGKRGGKPGGDEFVLGKWPRCMKPLNFLYPSSLRCDFTDTRRGEILMGFYVRAGFWIDGIEILTSFGRKSGIYGNATGGSG